MTNRDLRNRLAYDSKPSDDFAARCQRKLDAARLAEDAERARELIEGAALDAATHQALLLAEPLIAERVELERMWVKTTLEAERVGNLDWTRERAKAYSQLCYQAESARLAVIDFDEREPWIHDIAILRRRL